MTKRKVIKMFDNTDQNQAEEETLRLTIEQAEMLKAKGEALDRLFSNPDFQTIVEEDYFKDEAVRFVMLKADPNTQGDEWEKNIERGLTGISQFRFYLDSQRAMCRNAEKALKDAEKELALAESEKH